MQRVPVVSSDIASVGYNERTRVLDTGMREDMHPQGLSFGLNAQPGSIAVAQQAAGRQVLAAIEPEGNIAWVAGCIEPIRHGGWHHSESRRCQALAARSGGCALSKTQFHRRRRHGGNRTHAREFSRQAIGQWRGFGDERNA